MYIFRMLCGRKSFHIGVRAREAGRAATPPPQKKKLETASFSGNLFPNFGEFGRLDTGHGGIRERNDSHPLPS